MPLSLKRGLWLWAASLLLVLVAVAPFSGWARVLMAVTVLCGVAWVWVCAGRRAIRQGESLIFADPQSLPQMDYRKPVVLVCGDGLTGLFGEAPTEQLALRTTAQGCYLRVAGVEQLPAVIESLLALRPDWAGQLSVMFVVNPAEHRDVGGLSGQVSALCHQITLVRKRGVGLPLLLASYLQTATGEGPWFAWSAGQSSPSVREVAASGYLGEWQQATHSATQAARLRTRRACVLRWPGRAVAVPRRPCAAP